MRRLIVHIVVLAAAAASAFGGPAAQTQTTPSGAAQPVALTQKIIDDLVAAEPAISALDAKAQADAPDKPHPEARAKMETVAKTHGFADLHDYERAADAVSTVLAGIDPDTKRYAGPAAMIRKQMSEVDGDKTLPAKDKAQTLRDMNEALGKVAGERPPAGNIQLVEKNYDKVSEGFQRGGD